MKYVVALLSETGAAGQRMKTSYILVLLLFSLTFLYGQEVPRQNPKKVAPNDTIVKDKGTREDQLRKIKEVKVEKLSDSAGNEPLKSKLVDTTIQNKYGDLLNDDKEYNKRYPFIFGNRTKRLGN
jgi:hypothetical protein